MQTDDLMMLQDKVGEFYFIINGRILHWLLVRKNYKVRTAAKLTVHCYTFILQQNLVQLFLSVYVHDDIGASLQTVIYNFVIRHQKTLLRDGVLVLAGLWNYVKPTTCNQLHLILIWFVSLKYMVLLFVHWCPLRKFQCLLLCIIYSKLLAQKNLLEMSIL